MTGLTTPLKIKQTQVPKFIYGTAWKEEATEALTLQALNNGFSGIDTANQRKHYYEAGVGEALRTFFQNSEKVREDLFLQSKYTYPAGQDDRLPYDPYADYEKQVGQSFNSTLEHLETDYLDAFLLHGPSVGVGLSETDFQVWQAMEALYRSGKVKLLGISNVNAEQLEFLAHHAAIKPAFVQNRCFAATGWDLPVRAVCQRHGICYQGFSLLTANPAVISEPEFQGIIRRTGLTAAQIVFQASLRMGMIVLTGTSDHLHMLQDLNCDSECLTEEEVRQIELMLLKRWK